MDENIQKQLIPLVKIFEKANDEFLKIMEKQKIQNHSFGLFACKDQFVLGRMFYTSKESAVNLITTFVNSIKSEFNITTDQLLSIIKNIPDNKMDKTVLPDLPTVMKSLKRTEDDI